MLRLEVMYSLQLKLLRKLSLQRVALRPKPQLQPPRLLLIWALLKQQ